jgi:hypothetical protein
MGGEKPFALSHKIQEFLRQTYSYLNHQMTQYIFTVKSQHGKHILMLILNYVLGKFLNFEYMVDIRNIELELLCMHVNGKLKLFQEWGRRDKGE